MIPFTLDVKESKRLVSKGILCIIRFDGKKLYVRLVKADDKGNLELKPLSKTELSEAAIEESELIINDEYYVEESEKTPAEEQNDKAYEELKKKTFNSNSQSDMEQAKKLAEKQLEKLGASDEIQRLKDEAEDYKAKLEMVALMNLERKRRELNAPSDIDTVEKLVGYEKGLRRETNSAPSGSAPLNEYQLGNGKIGFETHEQMIKWLRDNPTPENEAILRELFAKAVKGTKQSSQYPETEPQTSNAVEVNSDVMSSDSIKDPNIESDITKYNNVLKRRRQKASEGRSD